MKISEEQYRLIADRIINEINQKYFLVDRKSPPITEDHAAFLEYVLDFICQDHGLDIQPVRNGSQKREYVYLVRIYCYLARKHGDKKVSYELIGKFVNKDHSTMIASERKLIEEMEVNRSYREQIQSLEARFTSDRQNK